jgi:hypothetical protein
MVHQVPHLISFLGLDLALTLPMSNEALNPLLGPIVTFTCTLIDKPMMKIEILMSQSKSLVIIANKLKANVKD